MNPLGKFRPTPQTLIIFGLVAVVVVFVFFPGVIHRERGETGVDLEIIYADGTTLNITPGREYTFSVVSPLAIYDEAGKQITSVRARLWVQPVLTDVTATDVVIDYKRTLSISPPLSGFLSTDDTGSARVQPSIKKVLDVTALSFNHTQFLYGATGETWYTVTFSYSGTGSAGGYSTDFSTSAAMKVQYKEATPTGSITILVGVEKDVLNIVRR